MKRLTPFELAAAIVAWFTLVCSPLRGDWTFAVYQATPCAESHAGGGGITRAGQVWGHEDAPGWQRLCCDCDCAGVPQDHRWEWETGDAWGWFAPLFVDGVQVCEHPVGEPQLCTGWVESADPTGRDWRCQLSPGGALVMVRQIALPCAAYPAGWPEWGGDVYKYELPVADCYATNIVPGVTDSGMVAARVRYGLYGGEVHIGLAEHWYWVVDLTDPYDDKPVKLLADGTLLLQRDLLPGSSTKWFAPTLWTPAGEVAAIVPAWGTESVQPIDADDSGGIIVQRGYAPNDTYWRLTPLSSPQPGPIGVPPEEPLP